MRGVPLKTCPQCRRRFQPLRRGRPPKYCSDACRQAAYEHRRDPGIGDPARRVRAIPVWARELFKARRRLTDDPVERILLSRRSLAPKEAWLDAQVKRIIEGVQAASAALPSSMKYARPKRTHWHVDGVPVNDGDRRIHSINAIRAAEQEHAMQHTIPSRVAAVEDRLTALEEMFRAHLEATAQSALSLAGRVPEDQRIKGAVDRLLEEVTAI